MGDGDHRAYASPPCMAHEFEQQDDAFTLHILYLRIEEAAEGFRWHVRLHGAPDPIASGTESHGSESAARNAGQAALDRAAAQFRALKRFD